MKIRFQGLLGLVALIGLTSWSCTGSVTEPPAGQDEPLPWVVFQDPDSEFSTADVNDVEGQLVRFDIAGKAIVWAEDGAAYQAGSWETVDPYPESTQFFQVRFGTQNGERKAYFTETGRATICNIELIAGDIAIFATNEFVPQE